MNYANFKIATKQCNLQIMSVIPRLGCLSKVREPHTGWETLPRMCLFTQDGSFYPGWATLPRLGNHSRQKARIFRPKNLPETKQFTQAVQGLQGSFSMSLLNTAFFVMPHFLDDKKVFTYIYNTVLKHFKLNYFCCSKQKHCKKLPHICCFCQECGCPLDWCVGCVGWRWSRWLQRTGGPLSVIDPFAPHTA